jgi:RsiW-degrading membrane proteinase PrsW (M82 family)
MATLTIVSGTQRCVLEAGQDALIGRGSDCQVVVGDPRVSRQHVKVTYAQQGWVLQDIGRSGTWVLGQPISNMAITHSLEVHLAEEDGPSVIFQPSDPTAPASAGAAIQPGTPVVGTPMPARVGSNFFQQGSVALRHNGLATALSILVPVRSWIHNPGWKQGVRLLFLAYGLAPVIFTVAFQNATALKTPGWVYAMYVAPLWLIAFWYLIKPGRLGWREAGIATFIVVTEYLLMLPNGPVIRVEQWAFGGNFAGIWQWTLGVGLVEESAKAIPVLVAAIFLLKVKGLKLDVRMWMLMGTIAGLTFGVVEAAIYTQLAQANVIQGSEGTIAQLMQFAERVFIDGFQHAIWAGITGFFIGLAINYRKRRIPLIAFGLALTSLLHGFNDWVLGTSLAHEGWIAACTVSLLLFLGYTLSAASIEQEVRHSAMFRGESLVADPSMIAALRQDPPQPSPSA